MRNPFEYDAANNLPDEEIIDYYISDYNFSRFIQSTKNIFLVGERGSGKTMTMLYNSFRIQHKIKGETDESYDWIGVHIACNDPLFDKKDYLLVKDEYKRSLMCEHFMVLKMLYCICDTLSSSKKLSSIIETKYDCLIKDIEYEWDVNLSSDSKNFLAAIKKYVQKENHRTQHYLNEANDELFYENMMSFSATIWPFLNLMRTTLPEIEKTHFMLMFDDVQDLNEYQIRILNSWIAYRDHSVFSFKLASSKVARPSRITTSGGSILEGHDYITVDMEQPYQNSTTPFYKLSKEIIEKRLHKIGLDGISAEDFFPINKDFERDLERYKDIARGIAIEKYGDNKQSINDYVTKYHRAMYFRERSAKSNRPPYSGFSTLTDLSTGVVRNLLDPCYWMWDAVMDEQKEKITYIPANIQNNVIINRSQTLWNELREGLERSAPNCTKRQADAIKRLLEELAALFAKRLQADISEPRAIVFSISQIDSEELTIYDEVMELIKIARRTQYIYVREGNSKEKGKREIYYIPNRMLFPNVGLDVHGQFSHVSLKLRDIYNVAFNGKTFKFNQSTFVVQPTLFDTI